MIHARRARARKVKTLLKADVKTDDTCHSEPRKRSSLRSQTSQSNPSRTLLTEKQHPKRCPGTPEKQKSHIFTESVPKGEMQQCNVPLLVLSSYEKTRESRITALCDETGKGWRKEPRVAF